MGPRLRQLGFKLLDSPLGGGEGLLLNEDDLRERVGGVRRLLGAPSDIRLRLLIARIALRRADAIEKIGDQLSFVRRHHRLRPSAWASSRPGLAKMWAVDPISPRLAERETRGLRLKMLENSFELDE
jgi:hypothetical protein